MPFEDTVRIPLRAKDGSVVAYTVVDAADAEYINQWRWCLSRAVGGYARRSERIGGRLVTIKLHRSLLGLTPGDGLEVDHISRDTLDNRRANLRVVPAKGAQRQNVSSARGSSSSHRGVCWHRGKAKWQAQIKVSGKRIHLGYFDTEQEAAQAALEGRRRHLPYAVD